MWTILYFRGSRHSFYMFRAFGKLIIRSSFFLPLKIKDSPQVSSCWLFFETIYLYLFVGAIASINSPLLVAKFANTWLPGRVQSSTLPKPKLIWQDVKINSVNLLCVVLFIADMFNYLFSVAVLLNSESIHYSWYWVKGKTKSFWQHVTFKTPSTCRYRYFDCFLQCSHNHFIPLLHHPLHDCCHHRMYSMYF